MKKFKNIEFLRIIGCCAIVLLHLFSRARYFPTFKTIDLYAAMNKMTSNGQKAVDLFFIISGFLFALNFKKDEPITSFLKRKFIRFYPVLLFCFVAFFLVSFTGAIDFHWYDNILNLLCLDGTVLVLRYGNNGLFWYVSSMMWTFVLFSYLLKNYEKKNVDLFITLAVFFCYGFILHARNGAINFPRQTYYNIFNVGVMRAIGGIGLGYIISEWYKTYGEKIDCAVLSFKQKFLVTCLEALCLFFTIYALMLHRISFNNNIVFIVCFAIMLMLFISKKGYISQFLEKDYWKYASRYTYSIFMTHQIVCFSLKELLMARYPNFVYSHPVANIFLILTCVLLLGIATYHLVEKPAANYLSKKLNGN